MAKDINRTLENLLNLAREYERKYRYLNTISEQTELKELIPRFIQQVELATDRFRSAQHILYSKIGNIEDDRDTAINAANQLSQCFDELLIVFHVLIDKLQDW